MSKNTRCLTIVLSALLLFFVVLTSQGLAQIASGGFFKTMKPTKFHRIYEPSGVQYLPDGRVIVIEDQSHTAIDILSFAADGTISEEIDLNTIFELKKKFFPNDLEGVAVNNEGVIYAITSHSLTKKGKQKRNRQQLIRLTIDENNSFEKKAYGKLLSYFLQLKLPDEGFIERDELNIEALSFDRQQKRLLIGFRSPLIQSKAVITVLKNPAEIFSENASPIFESELILLDLQGEGIRSLVYDFNLNYYLVLSRSKGKKSKRRSSLWLWDGEPNHKPQRMAIPQLAKLKNPEGIAPVRIAGKNKLLIVSDDGKAKKRKPAHYMFIDYNQLTVQ